MELVHAIQKLPTLPHDKTRPQQLVVIDDCGEISPASDEAPPAAAPPAAAPPAAAPPAAAPPAAAPPAAAPVPATPPPVTLPPGGGAEAVQQEGREGEVGRGEEEGQGEEEVYDAIVVGAGLAGLACARVLGTATRTLTLTRTRTRTLNP